jgi:hypothetical protein
MSIKDLLEIYFGIDFSTLSFELKKNLYNDIDEGETTAEEVKNMLENYEFLIVRDTFKLNKNNNIDSIVSEQFEIQDIDITDDQIQLYLEDNFVKK